VTGPVAVGPGEMKLFSLIFCFVYCILDHVCPVCIGMSSNARVRSSVSFVRNIVDFLAADAVTKHEIFAMERLRSSH
jgi:hypothetical protein